MSATNGSAASRSLQIEQAEALLCSLAGVVTARILTGPKGEVLEVYVVAGDDAPLRQVARNVQSALLAQLGILVDQRHISVAAARRPSTNGVREAPTSDPGDLATATATADGASRPPATRPRPRLDGLAIERAHPHRLRCRLTIACGETVLQGEAEAIDGPGVPLEVAARATLAAWQRSAAEDAPALELDGVRLVEIAGRPYVVAAIRARELRATYFPSGAAAVDDSPEEAAARAVIQAIEPWLRPDPRPVPSGPAQRARHP